MDFSFSITWVYGIITLGCAGFFLQMLLEYNAQRRKMMPQLQQIRDIRQRHDIELDKVGRLTQEAEAKLKPLEEELAGLLRQLRELEAELEELNRAEDKK